MHIAPDLIKRSPFFYGWVVVGGAGTVVFARNAVATLTLAVFISPMSEELDWPRTLIVGAYSAAGIAAMFASPVSGYVLQRLGARWVLAGSVAILGAAVFGLQWIMGPGLLYVVAFYLLSGTARLMFNSPIQIASATVVAQWFIRRRGRATAILMVMHSAGMGLFPLFARLLINGYDGDWRGAWLWMGVGVWIIALPATLMFIVNRPEDTELKPDGALDKEKDAKICVEDKERPYQENQEEGWSLSDARKTSTLWMLAAATGALYFVHTGVNIHSAAFFTDKGITPTVAAGALTLMAAGSAVGALAWGAAADRFSPKVAYGLAGFWLAGASLGFLIVNGTPSAFIAAGIFGIGLGALLVLPPVAFANYFGRRSLGAIRGVTEPFTAVGQSLGGIAAGLIYDLTGNYTASFPSFALLAMAAAAFIFLIRRPDKRTEGQYVR